jgi:hypothetical protein
MARRYLRPNPAILDQFEQHASRMRDASRARKRSVAFRNVVDDRDDHEVASVVDTLGKPMPSDVYEGDTHLRTLRTLLSMIDERGWERSAHQVRFHDSFERCVARVIYRKDWSTRRPAIMRHNGWAKCSSEVMIRCAFTQPRGPHTRARTCDSHTSAALAARLVDSARPSGTIFTLSATSVCLLGAPLLHSIAIFAACLALSLGLEIVVFSPARRASRKLLERMVLCSILSIKPAVKLTRCSVPEIRRQVEFVRVLDCEHRICEYNQEQCRITSFTGKKSLIRSFPSKVGVSSDAKHSNMGGHGFRYGTFRIDSASAASNSLNAGTVYTHSSLANRPHTPGTHLAHPWHTRGTPVAHPWHTRGTPVAHTWHTRGT